MSSSSFGVGRKGSGVGISLLAYFFLSNFTPYVKISKTLRVSHDDDATRARCVTCFDHHYHRQDIEADVEHATRGREDSRDTRKKEYHHHHQEKTDTREEGDERNNF